LCVTIPSPPSRTFFFIAENAAEKEAWINAIRSWMERDLVATVVESWPDLDVVGSWPDTSWSDLDATVHGSSPSPNDIAWIESNTRASTWESSETRECVICVEDLALGDQVRTLPCGHVYHKECVDTWLRSSRLCCLCRLPIDGAQGSGL
jgi:hypothetical protein